MGPGQRWWQNENVKQLYDAEMLLDFLKVCMCEIFFHLILFRRFGRKRKQALQSVITGKNIHEPT